MAKKGLNVLSTVSFTFRENLCECDIVIFFSLTDCLEKFVDIEELAESERFYCNTCKSKQRSTKKFWIRRLPNVSFYLQTCKAKFAPFLRVICAN